MLEHGRMFLFLLIAQSWLNSIQKERRHSQTLRPPQPASHLCHANFLHGCLWAVPVGWQACVNGRALLSHTKDPGGLLPSPKHFFFVLYLAQREKMLLWWSPRKVWGRGRVTGFKSAVCSSSAENIGARWFVMHQSGRRAPRTLVMVGFHFDEGTSVCTRWQARQPPHDGPRSYSDLTTVFLHLPSWPWIFTWMVGILLVVNWFDTSKH